MALQIRRGPNAQRATTLLQTGEVAWTTDTKKLYVGDGVTTGGVNILANIAGTGFVWNPSTEQLDLAGSTITGINADNVAETNGVVPRLWYRSSLGKTHASEIFTTVAGAAHSGISFSWDDVNQKLSATVTSENAQDAAAALFTAGTHTGISFAYGLTQDAANRIDATVSSEYIQDTVNDLFTAGVHTGISFTYSDSLNAMSAAVNMGGNLASSLVLNTFNISGTGNISNTGTMTATGNISTSAGSISANGSVSAGTTISATQGLGANLSLNSYDITGTGNINITGSITGDSIVTNSIVPLLGTSPVIVTAKQLRALYARNGSLAAIGDSPSIEIVSSRGTIAAPTTLLENDFAGAFGITGNINGTPTLLSTVATQVSNNNGFGTNTKPVRVVAFTLNAFGGYEYFAFDSSGILNTKAVQSRGMSQTDITNLPTLAYGASPASATGTIVYNTTNSRLQLYVTNTWDNILTSGQPIEAANYATGTYPVGTTVATIAGLVIGASGTFTCTSTTLTLGGKVTISGTNTGAGVVANGTYYITVTNGTTSFTLSATGNGSPISTTAGTPAGLTTTVQLPKKGMIIFDSTINDFMGYNGTNWVSFTGP